LFYPDFQSAVEKGCGTRRDNRPMKYRRRRIAFPAVCGVLCLLLIALWVRSFWWVDIALGRHYSFMSVHGCLMGSLGEDPTRRQTLILSQNLRPMREAGTVLRSGASYGFAYGRIVGSLTLGLPHLLPAIVAAGIRAAPWLPWRFSLRTLLIATTLVAIGLGLIVAAAR
jgi:hypothetical protein